MTILFVCTGNTCRSLMAEGYANKMASDLGLKEVSACSCGTYASFEFPTPKIVLELLKNEGVDASSHVSTPATKETIEKADLILVMEKSHLSDIVSLYPSAKTKTFLLKDFAGVNSGGEIRDPIGKPDREYKSCMEEIKECERKVFKKLFG